jgi:hypothetical protein
MRGEQHVGYGAAFAGARIHTVNFHYGHLSPAPGGSSDRTAARRLEPEWPSATKRLNDLAGGTETLLRTAARRALAHLLLLAIGTEDTVHPADPRSPECFPLSTDRGETT